MAELKLDLAVDARQAIRGVDNFGDALQDVVDDMKDVSRSGDKTETELERNFKAIAADAKKTGGHVDKSMSDGFHKAGDSVGEFKDEANSTAKETAASFDGSAESITGAFQEVAANAFAGFGPAGAIAGLAAAAGIGLLTQAFTDAEEHRKVLEERANDLANAYVDAGTTVLGTLALASRSADILTDPEQKKNAQDLATALGVDLATAVRVLAGDQAALATANGIVNGTTDEYHDLMGKLGGDYKSISGDEKKRFDQLQKQRDGMAEVNGITKTATQTFNTQQDVLKGLVKDAASATKQVDDLGNVLYTLPDGEQILIEADTGKATTDITKFKGDVDTIPKQHETKVQVSADLTALDRQIRNYRPPQIGIDGVIRFDTTYQSRVAR